MFRSCTWDGDLLEEFKNVGTLMISHFIHIYAILISVAAHILIFMKFKEMNLWIEEITASLSMCCIELKELKSPVLS